MNGLEFAPYEVLNGASCPLCGLTHYKFTGIARQRIDVPLTAPPARHIEQTIAARILGWVLECGCMLPSTEWEWIVAEGIPLAWKRRTRHLHQGVMIGDHGTQYNTFN